MATKGMVTKGSTQGSDRFTQRSVQGKSQLLPPAPRTTTLFPREKSILGVIYGVLLWAVMHDGTPLALCNFPWCASVRTDWIGADAALSSRRCTVYTKEHAHTDAHSCVPHSCSFVQTVQFINAHRCVTREGPAECRLSAKKWG